MQYVAAFRTRTGDSVCMGRLFRHQRPRPHQAEDGSLSNSWSSLLNFIPGLDIVSAPYK